MIKYLISETGKEALSIYIDGSRNRLVDLLVELSDFDSMAMPQVILDREIDFVSAMILSVGCVARNPVVLGAWALLIAVTSLLALVPWFLGLLVVLPVLGHATWHLYRRAVT